SVAAIPCLSVPEVLSRFGCLSPHVGFLHDAAPASLPLHVAVSAPTVVGSQCSPASRLAYPSPHLGSWQAWEPAPLPLQSGVSASPSSHSSPSSKLAYLSPQRLGLQSRPCGALTPLH